MTLTEFLLARIAEDEADANFAVDPNYGRSGWQWDEAARCVWNGTGQAAASNLDGADGPDGRLFDAGPHIARWDPSRVRAECEAKRRIVALHKPYPVPQQMTYGTITACEECGSVDDSPAQWPCATLRLLALPYADHPDYAEAWCP